MGEARRTRYLGDTNCFSEHTLGVLAVLPRMVSLLTDPEHLGDEKDPLEEEEKGDPCSYGRNQLKSDGVARCTHQGAIVFVMAMAQFG